MAKWDTVTDYDRSAGDFDRLRMPGSETVRKLKGVFASVPEGGKILSLGCGTGQYEEAVFDGKGVVGLDRSEEMLRIAEGRMEECVHGDMLNLPFEDGIFNGVYFVQSLHHVGANLEMEEPERVAARRRALGEAFRVLKQGPMAIVQRDPTQNAAIWFWDYFPKALATKLIIQPPVEVLMSWLRKLGMEQVTAVAVDDPMIDGFYTAEAPLQEAFQRSFSEFSYLSPTDLAEGMRELQAAIKAGRVEGEIEECRRRFATIGGTVFVISAMK